MAVKEIHTMLGWPAVEALFILYGSPPLLDLVRYTVALYVAQSRLPKALHPVEGGMNISIPCTGATSPAWQLCGRNYGQVNEML